MAMLLHEHVASPDIMQMYIHINTNTHTVDTVRHTLTYIHNVLDKYNIGVSVCAYKCSLWKFTAKYLPMCVCIFKLHGMFR